MGFESYRLYEPVVHPGTDSHLAAQEANQSVLFYTFLSSLEKGCSSLHFQPVPTTHEFDLIFLFKKTLQLHQFCVYAASDHLIRLMVNMALCVPSFATNDFKAPNVFLIGRHISMHIISTNSRISLTSVIFFFVPYRIPIIPWVPDGNRERTTFTLPLMTLGLKKAKNVSNLNKSVNAHSFRTG